MLDELIAKIIDGTLTEEAAQAACMADADCMATDTCYDTCPEE
jgi:hypothetical protein